MKTKAKLRKGTSYQNVEVDDETTARIWGEVTDIQEPTTALPHYFIAINKTDAFLYVDELVWAEEPNTVQAESAINPSEVAIVKCLAFWESAINP